MNAFPKVPQITDGRVDPVTAFSARCEANALLVALSWIDLQDAVDGLQLDAVLSGLVDEIGQDAVQAIMASAFGDVRC